MTHNTGHMRVVRDEMKKKRGESCQLSSSRGRKREIGSIQRRLYFHNKTVVDGTVTACAPNMFQPLNNSRIMQWF